MFNGIALTPCRPMLVGFTPLNIPNIAAWFDASDTTSIAHVSNGVSQWNDKSGNLNHATQGTANYRPITNTVTVNGKNALDFDGSEDHLNMAAALYSLTAGANTTFTVYKSDNAGDATQRIWVGSNGTGRFQMQLLTTSVGYLHSGTSTSGIVSKTVARDTNVHCVVGVRSGTSQSIYQDGGTVATNTNATNSTLTSYTISGNNTSGVRFDGKFCEKIIYSRALTTAELNQVGAYLAAKWGHTWTTI